MRRILVSVAAAAAALAFMPLAGPTAAHATTRSTSPQVKHVIQIQLENEEATKSFPGKGTELDKLAHQGVFLKDYFATGHASLDNYIAQLSGQAQYSWTSGDCYAQYRDNSGTVDAKGYYHSTSPDTGCVYPKSVKTLADQLTAAGKTWHGFMEDMGNDANRETATCGVPALAGGVPINSTVGGVDRTNEAESTDQYAARHNPFVYFHSLLDAAASGGASPCQRNVTSLRPVLTMLNKRSSPNYSWITPNLCDDGHDSPCQGPGADGKNPGAGGLVSANAFLAHWIPLIEQTRAFKDHGLIVVSFDEGSTADSCCRESGKSGIRTAGGGGRVGAVLLGASLHRHVSTCAYNHFSALRTYEDLFGLTPARTGIKGSDGKGHLAHAGDRGVGTFTRELTARHNPC